MDRKHPCAGQGSNNKTVYLGPDGGIFQKQPDNICPGCGGKQRTYQKRTYALFSPKLRMSLMRNKSLEKGSTGTLSVASETPCPYCGADLGYYAEFGDELQCEVCNSKFSIEKRTEYDYTVIEIGTIPDITEE